MVRGRRKLFLTNRPKPLDHQLTSRRRVVKATIFQDTDQTPQLAQTTALYAGAQARARSALVVLPALCFHLIAFTLHSRYRWPFRLDNLIGILKELLKRNWCRVRISPHRNAKRKNSASLLQARPAPSASIIRAFFTVAVSPPPKAPVT